MIYFSFLMEGAKYVSIFSSSYIVSDTFKVYQRNDPSLKSIKICYNYSSYHGDGDL